MGASGRIADQPTHACPPDGSVFMPCCGKTPFDVSPDDRITLDEEQVTCPTWAEVLPLLLPGALDDVE